MKNIRLTELRKGRNLSQEELAKQIGCSQSLIAHIESGTKDPGKENKIKLAKLFGVTVDYLFYELHYDLRS
jgi:transcriptional regulator with XRE-family HTH domain